MIKLPSGSKLGLAMKCLGSFMLPQVRSEPGPAAEDGIEKHAILEKYAKSGGSEEGLSEDDAAMCRRAFKTIGNPRFDRVRSEVGLLLAASGEPRYYCFSKGDEGPSDDMRSNGFYCVADVVVLEGENSISIWDWKTGSSYVSSPEWNWQLILPSCVAYVSAGRPAEFKARAGIVFVRPDRISADGDMYDCDAAEFCAADLDKHISRLEWLCSRAIKSSPDSVTLYEGKHCQYCPARDRCPAKIGAIASAFGVSRSMGDGHPVLDVDIVKAARTLLDSKPQIDKAEKEILRNNKGVLDLGDGREAVLEVDKRGKEKVYTRKSTLAHNRKTEDLGMVGAESGEEE